MRTRGSVLVAAVGFLFPADAEAQAQDAEDITREQVQTVLQGMIGASIDRQLKVVDIGEGNVAVGILHRTETHDTDGALRGMVHTEISEVYYILSGWGTLMTGGSLINTTEPGPDRVVGPTFAADPQSRTIRDVGVGDIVIIPAGVAHAWTEIPDHVTYLSIRPDPHRALPAGFVNPQIR